MWSQDSHKFICLNALILGAKWSMVIKRSGAENGVQLTIWKTSWTLRTQPSVPLCVFVCVSIYFWMQALFRILCLNSYHISNLLIVFYIYFLGIPHFKICIHFVNCCFFRFMIPFDLEKLFNLMRPHLFIVELKNALLLFIQKIVFCDNLLRAILQFLCVHIQCILFYFELFGLEFCKGG